MYDEVYKAMETAGVAVRLPDAVWVNKNQDKTTEDLAFGRKATHLLSRPDYVFLLMRLDLILAKREMEH
jgi:hypothetical protein